MRPALRDEFHKFGELVTELLKLATLLVFGALLSLTLFAELHALDFLFALLALIVARPIAMAIALWRSELDTRERLTAAWFGPKGFASVVYGLLLFERNVPHADRLFRLVALVIVGSIVAHSSTDTVLARWFVGRRGTGAGSVKKGLRERKRVADQLEARLGILGDHDLDDVESKEKIGIA